MIKLLDKQMSKDLAEFTFACIEALYFSETGEYDQPSPTATMDKQTQLNIEADCRSWWKRFGCFVTADQCIFSGQGVTKTIQAGYDFWFTRNGHGCGFWDGDWSSNYSKMFEDGAKGYGTFDIIKGDDRKIYS